MGKKVRRKYREAKKRKCQNEDSVASEKNQASRAK